MPEAVVTDTAIRAELSAPLWVQTVELIKHQIADGILRKGTRLPAERELCLQLGISRVTLRKALTALVTEGVLTPSHGRGWFVASDIKPDWPNNLESFSETARRQGLSSSSTVLRSRVCSATMDEAETLLIAPGAPVFQLSRLRLLDGAPVGIDDTLLSARLAPGLADADFTTASLYEELAAAGVHPARADCLIEAQPADRDGAGLLDMGEDQPLLVMKQVVYDASGHPIFTSTLRYRGDRYRLRTFFSRAPGALGGN